MATTTENPYSISKELLSNYLKVDFTEMQLYRISDYYGGALSETLASNECLLPVSDKKDVVYAMADGSMILTREEQWKEAKLGRIFRGKDCLQPEGKVGKIKESQYVSHFGGCTDFTEKMERVLDSYGDLNERLIFITDGAVWLRNWTTDAYPKAISILDFYHAKEYLCDFAKAYFKDEGERKAWVEQQTELLLESQAEQVIETVQTLSKQQQNKEAADKLINYYTDNLERMDYKYYQSIGKGLIGSGAMESSHRTVIQCRMKLSGQRWSKKGAENMLHLRTLKMNKQWDKVVEAIHKYAKYKIAV
ncbi:MAG: UPF0236 family protein, partial [Chitinophagaceae bacterium]|nr:UPF0236 family protein [Chitinophagaceae bacterium]